MSKEDLFNLRSNGRKGSKGVAGPAGPTGAQGVAGPGVATGGTTGQVLAKASNAAFDTHWIDVTTSAFGNIDGGKADTNFGGLDSIVGGNA
jgi:hypothetical protein